MPTDPTQLLSPNPDDEPRITSIERVVAAFQTCTFALFIALLGVIMFAIPKLEDTLRGMMDIEPPALTAAVARLVWLKWWLIGLGAAIGMAGLVAIFQPKNPLWIRHTKVPRLLVVFVTGLLVAVAAIIMLLSFLAPLYNIGDWGI